MFVCDYKPLNDVFFLKFQITNEGCLGWCLEEALSHQYNKDPLIRKWLIGDKVSNFLVDIVEKEINDCCPPDFSVLFKLAITENDDEGNLFHRCYHFNLPKYFCSTFVVLYYCFRTLCEQRSNIQGFR